MSAPNVRVLADQLKDWSIDGGFAYGSSEQRRLVEVSSILYRLADLQERRDWKVQRVLEQAGLSVASSERGAPEADAGRTGNGIA